MTLSRNGIGSIHDAGGLAWDGSVSVGDLLDPAGVHFDRADIYLDRLESHLPTC